MQQDRLFSIRCRSYTNPSFLAFSFALEDVYDAFTCARLQLLNSTGGLRNRSRSKVISLRWTAFSSTFDLRLRLCQFADIDYLYSFIFEFNLQYSPLAFLRLRAP